MAKKKKEEEFNEFEHRLEEEEVPSVEELASEQEQLRCYSTGSFMLDCAIGKKDPFSGKLGIPEKAIVECFGPPGSLKTATSDSLAKSVLESDPSNYVIAFYAEDSDLSRLDKLGFTPDMLRRFRTLSVDPEEDLKFQSAEKNLNKILDFCEYDQVKLVIIDSVKALCTTGDLYDKKGNFFDLEKAGPVGERATKFGLFVKHFANRSKRAILFMINQTSDHISTGLSLPYGVPDSPDMKTPGGRAKEFYSNLRIKTSAKVIYTETEHPLHGSKLGEGYEIRYKLVKNKFCGESATIMHKATSRFMLDPIGFARIDDIIACAEYLKLEGISKGGGGYWTIYGERMRGQETINKYFKDHPEIVERLELEVSARAGEIYANHTKKKSVQEELLSDE